MTPLNCIIRNCTGGYKFAKSQENINQLVLMDDNKLFAKKLSRVGDSERINKNLQPRFRNEIWHWKMSCDHKEKWEKTNNERNRTAKAKKKILNVWKKGKLQVLGNIGNGHHQTRWNERKIRKEFFRRTGKHIKTKLCSRNLRRNDWAVRLVKYSGQFLI